MSKQVVVAGATGYAGRHLVRELSERGYRVRAVVRSRTRAEMEGAFGAPSLAGLVAEWREGDMTNPAFVAGLCEGAESVVSALGVTRQRADPWDVDYLANLHLLEDTERASVGSFLYINVMHANRGRSQLLRSKAAFAQTLSRSSVSHQIINPSGYFSDMTEFLAMARRGLVVVPPAQGIKIAPIHGADLARFSIERLGGPVGSWDVGGPDALGYEDIARLAAAAVGKRCRIVTIPRAAVTAAVWCAQRIGGRIETLAEFFADGLVHDAVGEQYGQHHLGAYFKNA